MTAARVGREPRTIYRTPKAMVRRGQIRFDRRSGKLVFALMPWAVGIYEEQLPRMDQEMAMVLDQCFLEIEGALAQPGHPIHRVVPIRETIPTGIEIYLYELAYRLLESAWSNASLGRWRYVRGYV